MAVIVDDGSGPDFAPTFERLCAMTDVIVLRHAVNLGKGAALKTALNHAACDHAGAVGVVTADADGQHAPEDVVKTAAELVANPTRLVLGCREFTGDVPARSKIGNVATRYVMWATTGQFLTDTQTGLRGIPMNMIPDLLRSKANGYDFELDMLVACKRAGRKIHQTTIRTIYEDGNKSSHFNPLFDSMRIYFVFLRFSGVSIITALLDNVVFTIWFHAFPHILEAMCAGRLVAGVFNYTANKAATFKTGVRDSYAIPKFLLSMLIAGTLSYLLIRVFVRAGLPVIPAKLLAETIMFFFSFWIQREFVFRPAPSAEEQP
jgi:dolichol-phosphate mannosyltransferase